MSQALFIAQWSFRFKEIVPCWKLVYFIRVRIVLVVWIRNFDHPSLAFPGEVVDSEAWPAPHPIEEKAHTLPPGSLVLVASRHKDPELLAQGAGPKCGLLARTSQAADDNYRISGVDA